MKADFSHKNSKNTSRVSFVLDFAETSLQFSSGYFPFLLKRRRSFLFSWLIHVFLILIFSKKLIILKILKKRMWLNEKGSVSLNRSLLHYKNTRLKERSFWKKKDDRLKMLFEFLKRHVLVQLLLSHEKHSLSLFFERKHQFSNPSKKKSQQKE